MLTFTASFGDRPLKDALHLLQKAYTRFHSGEMYQKLCKDYSITYEIKSIEITYNNSAQSWHPHIHTLIFLQRVLGDSELVMLETDFLQRWERCTRACNIKSYEYGLVALPVSVTSASYLVKGAYSAKDPNHFSAWDLLEASAKERIAGDLFIEYANAVYGKPFLFWSAGLRKSVLIGKSKVNERKSTDKGCLPAFTIPANEWKDIQARNEVVEMLVTINP
jgi:hypothetical protein